jgi:hypothetical protein
MVEFIDDRSAEEFFGLLYAGEKFDGPGYLEYVCSAFFGRTLRCSPNTIESRVAKNYNLFCRDSSFVYGQA